MLGRRLTPLEYDLSTPQLIQESARNFYEVYGEDDEAILAFAKALQGIVRVHRAEGYHPRRQRSQPAASVEGEAVAEAEAVEAVETAPSAMPEEEAAEPEAQTEPEMADAEAAAAPARRRIRHPLHDA